MKKLIFTFLIFLIFCSVSFASDDWHGQDKRLHFIAGSVISMPVFIYQDIRYPDKPLKKKWLTAWFIGSGAGLGKELYDMTKSGNHFCWKDLVVTSAGAAILPGIGVGLVYLEHGSEKQYLISKIWSW